MAESNWTFVSGGLTAAEVARGVSAGFTVPNGGGSYVFGFNSLDTELGSVGLYCNQANFNPLLDDDTNPGGGSVRGAIKRGTSAGPLSFSPFLFIGLQADSMADSAYVLGLADNDPHEIVLAKQVLGVTLDPTSSSVLGTSTATYDPDTWLHLRLDMIVNPNGDVVLKAFYNDLDTNAVTAPVWTAITGLTDFIDDALEVNSGSTPLVGGKVGYGMYTANSQRRGYFDHLEVYRQK